MNISVFEFVLLALASFRLTRLIVFDKITTFLRRPFFQEVKEEDEEGVIEVYYLPKDTPIKKFIGELLSCYWCTGIWSSIALVLIFYLIPAYSHPIILVLAIAGLASILECMIQLLIDK